MNKQEASYLRVPDASNSAFSQQTLARLFFGACGFGDDILGSTTMIYNREASSNIDDAQIITLAGRKLLIAPPLRVPLIS